MKIASRATPKWRPTRAPGSHGVCCGGAPGGAVHVQRGGDRGGTGAAPESGTKGETHPVSDPDSRTWTGTGTPSTQIPLAPGCCGPVEPLNLKVCCNLKEWRHLGVSRWVMETVPGGMYLPWLRTPPRSRENNYLMKPIDRYWLYEEL